jgi:hypothetical protein
MKQRSLEQQNQLLDSRLEEENQLLASWRGAQAKVWLFHVSHMKLAICLSRFKERNACYVVATGCRRIAGPFSWKSADILITRQALEKLATPQYTVTDRGAGFELVCGSASVVSGAAFVPTSPFQGFSSESIPRKLSDIPPI